MRNDFRLDPAPARYPNQRNLLLRRGLITVTVLAICASLIYMVVSDTETQPMAEVTAPAQNRLSLAIPGKESSNPQPIKSVVVELKPKTIAMDAQKPIATNKPKDEPVAKPSENTSTSLALPEAKPNTEEADTQNQSEQATDKWLEETVNSGDSLALIFNRLGLSANLLHKITHSSKEAMGLTSIMPGESLRIRLNDKDELQELIYQRSLIEALHITPEGDSYNCRTEIKPVETRQAQNSGTIVSSFYLSAQKVGLSDALIMNLATIFGWDIDFALEIRKGDSFSVVYEEGFLDGIKYGSGKILAAEFVNRGKVYRAIRYEKDNGDYDYYSPDGKSMRKAFLRAPVDFRRISSRFRKERFHPVLGKKRPHRGVDYAAATGTPIQAAGDGRVVFRGTKGGYGRTIILKHGSQYSTLYAHLSRYRSSVKNGTKVRQGQTIGYVGKSGLATGPHLHYEFRINGAHRNPLTVKLPASAPIEKKYKEDFLRKSKTIVATLDSLRSAMLAETTKQ